MYAIDIIVLVMMAMDLSDIAILNIKGANYYCFFFFSQEFLTWTLTTHRTTWKGRGPSFIPLYHFHLLTKI